MGVKQQGGEVSHVISEVEVSCEAKDLPEFIEVDLSNVEVGQILHLSDLKLPKGVQLVALAHGNNLAVANIHASRAE
ncbi:50S ribosomal protein L25 [compost metagenome]